MQIAVLVMVGLFLILFPDLVSDDGKGFSRAVVLALGAIFLAIGLVIFFLMFREGY